jgi:tetratricopeptide (TPR) repeat protein
MIKGKKSFTALHLGIIVIFSFLIYAQAIHFGLTAYDDKLIIENIKSIFNSEHLFTRFFTTDAFISNSNPFYRPLQSISYYADMKISGVNEFWMLHLSNVLLYGLIGCCLYVFLLKLNIDKRLSFWGTLAYISHPLFVMAVAWIPARGDLLLTLFTLSSLLFFIRFLENKSYLNLILVWLSFTLALFSKETAAFIPFVLAIYLFLFQPNFKIDFKYVLLTFLGLISGIIWYILKTKSVYFGADISELSFKFNDLLWNLLIIPASISQFFIPYELATSPRVTATKVILGLLLMVLIGKIILKKTKDSSKIKVFSLFWFFILLVPTFFIKHKYIDYLEHRFLLPMIGLLILLLTQFPAKWIENNKVKNTWVFALIIILFSAISFVKSKSYQDEDSYIDATIKYNGRTEVAYLQRGFYKQQLNDNYGALDDYNKAIDVDSSYATAYNNRAVIKYNMKDYSNSILDCNKAITLDNKYASAYQNRANCFFMQGKYNNALADFSLAIKYNQHNKNDNSMSFYRRGMSYFALKDYPKASSDFNSCIANDVNFSQVYLDKGNLLLNIAKYKEALLCFDTAIKLDSQFYDAYYLRAATRLYLGNIEDAKKDCQKILLAYPNESNATELMKKILAAKKTNNKPLKSSNNPY